MLWARRQHRVLAAITNALRRTRSTADDPICGKVWHRRATKRYVQKLDIGRVHKFGLERVRKFGIWARSELGIRHDVRRAFRTGGIRTWGRNRAVKTNRLVCFLCHTHRSHQWTTFDNLWRHMTRFHTKMCILGVQLILIPNYGVKVSKSAKKRTRISISKPNRRKIKLTIILKRQIGSAQYLWSKMDNQIGLVFVGDPTLS